MRPFYRDAQPVVTAAPPSWSYQDIGAAALTGKRHIGAIEEFLVDLLDVQGNLWVIRCCKILIGLHIHHIHHILRDSVSGGVVRTQQTLLIGNALQVFIQHLLTVNNRSDLQQVELSRTVVVYITSQFYLHRTFHGLGAKLHRHLQQLRQREDIMLEHATHRNYLPTSLIITIAYHLVNRIVGTADIAYRSIQIRLFDAQFLDVETIIHLEIVPHLRHIECIETGLRLFQGDIHLAHLKQSFGMIRIHPQGLSAVNNVLSQSKGQAGHTFLCFLIVNGIIVQ